MQMNIAQLEACLGAMSIDTTAERTLLTGNRGGQSGETILVTGDQQADIYALLPLPEQIFFPDECVPFPLMVEYADSFSIQAVNDAREIEKYHSVADFRHFCGDRFRQIQRCTVYIPDEALRTNRLIFFTLDQNLRQIAQACPHYTGCVLVAAADAGGLSEDYLDLCRWLAEELCISKRVALLLNNSGVFDNPMLEFMAQAVLDRKSIGVIRREADGQPLGAALKAALWDIGERSMEGVSDAVAAACCGRVRERLNAQILLRQDAEKTSRIFADKYSAACRNYYAMCVTEKYASGEILTQAESDNLRREIRDMFARLRAAFPPMVEEVLRKIPKPKQDLKNFAGDYLGAVINDFIEKILNEVLEDVLVPRTHERFQYLCDRFRRMMQDVDLEYTQIEDSARAVFLKMGDVNIGDFHTPLAQITGALVTFILKTSITTILSELGLGTWGYYIGVRLDDFLKLTVATMTDAVMPTKAYAKSVTKVLLEQLDELEEKVLEQIQGTIMPRMSGVLQTEFDKIVAVYYDQLQKKAESYQARCADARNQIETLTADLEALNAFERA